MPIEPLREKGDLISYLKKAGSGIKKLFAGNRKENKSFTIPGGAITVEITTYGIVYANQLAAPEFEKVAPAFPAGSIIVREKHLLASIGKPQLAIAMVKHEKGFNAETGDWEFFVFNGSDLKLNQRETKGSCAECHTAASETDWVFRKYLKKQD